MHPEKEWFEQAKNQTIKTLPEFINHVMNDYEHDYGTVVHAISACAIAATWAANKEDGARGGITGFQAGFVMWDFVRQFMYNSNKCGLNIIDYDKMLYPQYEDKFQKTINKSTWEALQEQAKENINDVKNHGRTVHPEIVLHWKMIADGHVPFGYTVNE